ncbi:MAG: hypothetical protein BAA01_11375 [Bacillus thermozeamaize]|uniref:Uncharacterized protein n=1 Tax=Bacillus thermozeamaize TaxID=230954 RepID=A0A1Y3PA56_9BACI|nr:MAG: hypothetical protein BAA01_11375 [Bacillus thermozeamaize]
MSVDGQTITVSGVTLSEGETLTITYGDRSGGGPGAKAPTTPGVQVWQARSAGHFTGTPQNLAVSDEFHHAAAPSYHIIPVLKISSAICA